MLVGFADICSLCFKPDLQLYSRTADTKLVGFADTCEESNYVSKMRNSKYSEWVMLLLIKGDFLYKKV